MRFLTVMITACALVGCTRSAGRDEPGTLISPDMAYTQAFDPYDPNPVTANGATLLMPPRGTVPVGASYFPPGTDLLAARQVANPVPSNKDTLKRGKHIFDTFCVVCHGDEGNGDGPIIGRFPNPPSLHGDKAKTATDGELYRIISRGQGLMAAYGLQVRPPDLWRVILYIRSMQSEKK